MSQTDFDPKTQIDRLGYKYIIFQFWANLNYFQGRHEIDLYIKWINPIRPIIQL